MVVGAVVQSLFGRDRYRVFMIVGVCEDGRVKIADGKLHKLAFPKKKNLRHLRVLATPGDTETSVFREDDNFLYQMLKKFDTGE